MLPHDPAPPFSPAEAFPGKCHSSGHRPAAPAQVQGFTVPLLPLRLPAAQLAPRSAVALMLPWYDPHGREMGDARLGWGALGPSVWLCQRPNVGAPAPGLPRMPGVPWPPPLKITLRNQASPPRRGPSKATGTSVAPGNEPFGTLSRRYWSWLTSAHAACPCQPWPLYGGAWQLQPPKGGHSPGLGTATAQHLPVPFWQLPASPGGCCANQGAHPTAPCQAAPLRPRRGDWCGRGV